MNVLLATKVSSGSYLLFLSKLVREIGTVGIPQSVTAEVWTPVVDF